MPAPYGFSAWDQPVDPLTAAKAMNAYVAPTPPPTAFASTGRTGLGAWGAQPPSGAVAAQTQPAPKKAEITIPPLDRGPAGDDALAKALIQEGYSGENRGPWEVAGHLAQVYTGTKKLKEYQKAQQDYEYNAYSDPNLLKALSEGRTADVAKIMLTSRNPALRKMGIERMLAQSKSGPPELKTAIGDDGREHTVAVYPDGTMVWGPAKTGLLSPEEEAQKARLAKEQAAAGATNVTTNVGGQKIPDSLIQVATKASDEADNAIQQQTEIAQFADALKGAHTGPLAPLSVNIRTMLKSLGLSDAQVGNDVSVDQYQLLQALQNQQALRLRNPASGFGLTGNTSNQDVRFLQSMVPGIEKMPGANEAMLILLGAKFRRQGLLSQAKADWIWSTGSLAGWGDQQRQLIDSTPFLTEEEVARLNAIRSGAADTVPTAPGAPGNPAVAPWSSPSAGGGPAGAGAQPGSVVIKGNQIFDASGKLIGTITPGG